MKKLLFLLLLITCGCEEEATLSIPKDKMVDILVDMQMAESAMQRLVKKSRDTMSVKYYQQIYEIHDIDEKEFSRNFLILEKNPKIAKEIYDEVLSKLTTAESEN